MNAFVVTICGLVILLGFEIRYRGMTYQLELLKIAISELEKQTSEMAKELKLKQNVYEEKTRPV